MPNFNNHFLIDYIKVYKPKTTNTTWDYKQNNKTSLDNTAVNINSSVTNVAQSKFSIYTSGNNIFYKGTDSRLWNYWWNGSSFSSSCVNWNVTDINSDVTADAYNSRIWYRTSTNGLKYFLNGNSNTTGVTNCAGYITAAPSLSKVYYKGTDGKLWNYYKTSSTPETWTYAAITSSTNVAGGICINAAGTDIYYRGTNNNIYKVSWSGGAWQSPVQLNTNANVTDDIVFDEANTKLYYRSSTDNRLYNCYYIVSSGTWNTTALSWDVEDQDVIGSIAIDANKGVIYYLGTNNTLRHYYHDNGWNTGGGRWYNSTANGNVSPSNVAGPIVVRNDGVVYYRNSGGSIFQSAWTNGEVLNPANNPSTGPYYAVYKKTLISNDPENNSLSTNGISIDAYPNPSDESLNFVFDLKESSEITLLIYDAMGNIVSMPINKEYKDKGSHQYSFTNLDLKAGTYFFELKSKSWTYRGKIVRY
ncbi:MAG: T9SS type A sorting domain-containing protein [Cytophagaceae bacterium]|nr:T9SS type A sorting domain-containing protein [Cytophagaceae bacterium]